MWQVPAFPDHPCAFVYQHREASSITVSCDTPEGILWAYGYDPAIVNETGIKGAYFGGKGDDHLVGGSNRDRLFGGADNDTLEGRGFVDWLEGEGGNDYLYGDAGCGQIWKTDTLDPANPAAITSSCWANGFGGMYGLAEDSLGELYVVVGAANRIDCIHSGEGCYWAAWGIFSDGFESGDVARWSSVEPP